MGQYNTGSPARDYELIHKSPFPDVIEGELDCHLELKRYADEFNGEWFRISNRKAINAVKRVNKKALHAVKDTLDF